MRNGSHDMDAVGIDHLLTSDLTRTFQLELTSKCDLRCVYCAVSQPDYRGQDLAMNDVEALVPQLVARGIAMVQLNGHGETTTVRGWQEHVRILAARGVRLSLISNFARLFTPVELEALAHIDEIAISVDTHDPRLLRKLRRRVDLGNILLNMAGVRMTARRLGIAEPQFCWNCVLTDRVAPGFMDYINFALGCGVRHFFVGNLTKYDDVEKGERVRHVTELGTTELADVALRIERATEMVAAAGGRMSIQDGLTDSIRAELVRRRNGCAH
jgi:MoaA/NifB/PqqE/SkfB family radical SAM enzyme